MNLRFACPTCDRTGSLELPAAAPWPCPGCDALVAPIEPTVGPPEACSLCGNHELYRKKDFPHWLGMSILAVACVGSFIPYYLHLPGWTWGILLGSALLDGLLYLLVGNVTVCYRCAAEHRGLPRDQEGPPYDLTTAERYRQERLRRQLQQTPGRQTG